MRSFIKHIIMLLVMGVATLYVVNSNIINQALTTTAAVYSTGGACFAGWQIIKPVVIELHTNPRNYAAKVSSAISNGCNQIWKNKRKLLNTADTLYNPILLSIEKVEPILPFGGTNASSQTTLSPAHQQSAITTPMRNLGMVALVGLGISGAVWYLFKHWSKNGVIEPQKPRIEKPSGFARLRNSDYDETLFTLTPETEEHFKQIQDTIRCIQKDVEKVYPRLLFYGPESTNKDKYNYAKDLALAAHMNFITIPSSLFLHCKETTQYTVLDTLLDQLSAHAKDTVVFLERAEQLLTINPSNNEDKGFMDYFIYRLDSLKDKCLVIFEIQTLPAIHNSLTKMLEVVTFTVADTDKDPNNIQKVKEQ